MLRRWFGRPTMTESIGPCRPACAAKDKPRSARPPPPRHGHRDAAAGGVLHRLTGFALQEAAIPFEGPGSVAEVAEPIIELLTTDAYPRRSCRGMRTNEPKTSSRWRPRPASNSVM